MQSHGAVPVRSPRARFADAVLCGAAGGDVDPELEDVYAFFGEEDNVAGVAAYGTDLDLFDLRPRLQRDEDETSREGTVLIVGHGSDDASEASYIDPLGAPPSDEPAVPPLEMHRGVRSGGMRTVRRRVSRDQIPAGAKILEVPLSP